jgi:hypothetical protein
LESRIFHNLENPWTPVFTGATTFCDTHLLSSRIIEKAIMMPENAESALRKPGGIQEDFVSGNQNNVPDREGR